jgi:hypothetical protein
MIGKLQCLGIGFEAQLEAAHRGHGHDAAGSKRIGGTGGS